MTERQAHTPGPWAMVLRDEATRPNGAVDRQWDIRAADGNHPICDIFYVTPVGEANARLIAAAPDLKTAAGLALQSNMLGTNEPSVTISRAAYDALRAAYAKTEGN